MYYKAVAKNRKAFHNYFIEETLEAGMVLVGSEVKSLRAGQVSIVEAHIIIRDNEVFLLNAHITEYKFATYDKQNPIRERKLLLHKREIKKLKVKITREGYTAIPLKIYFKGNHAKVEIGIAKGKHNYDKRATLKAKTQNREINRAMKNY